MRTRASMCKNIRATLVLYPVQGIQSPKDKGYPKLCWRIQSHQQSDVDSCYKKTRKQFWILSRVDQKYDSNIKQIFCLYNVSIHKSNKAKDTIARHHPNKDTLIPIIFLQHHQSLYGDGGGMDTCQKSTLLCITLSAHCRLKNKVSCYFRQKINLHNC